MNTCPDCGVEPGALHVIGCDVERCKECGRQALGGCHPDAPPSRWTGTWPGEVEAREFGLFTKNFPGVPDGTPDLNKLALWWFNGVVKWDSERERYVRVE